METLGTGMINTADSAVTLALCLIGVTALFLGLMKVAEAGGLLVVIARLLCPLMVKLFPGVPADHPTMGAMTLNMSANALGLGNAATPFGIRAMQELDKLNPHKGTATDAMVMFLVINTANVTILPTGVIALRAAVDSADPAAVVPLTLFYGKTISPWIIPGTMAGILIDGAVKRVRIYEVFVERARDGFTVAVRIIPYLVAILVAIAMLRASGALDAIIGVIEPLTGPFGLPTEALPMALMRSLSGSGAYGIMADALKDPAIGPDSYAGLLISAIQGSSETTFYVLAVYCGAIGVRHIRHAVVVGIIADVAAVAVCGYMAARFSESAFRPCAAVATVLQADAAVRFGEAVEHTTTDRPQSLDRPW